MNFFFQSILALICVLGLCGTSCQKKTGEQSKAQSIRLSLKNEPATLDPRKGGDVISSNMHFLLFEGLVRLTAEGSVIPAQAESFMISEEGTVYTFVLRNSVWSDGTPVTAFDFEKAWKDVLDPSFPSLTAHLFYPIKNAEAAKSGRVSLSEVGISAKDSKTFVVTLEKPTPYFLDLISFCVFFPVSSQIDKKFPDWAHNAGEHFVSNGPFVLKEWKHSNELVAMKNPMYWDHAQVRPDFIHFSIIDDEMTTLRMFESGELDMIGEPLSPLPTDALAALQKDERVHNFPVGGTTIISFNVNKAPFNNAKIRKAFGYAINRETIVKNITQTGQVAALNAIPPMLKNHRNRAFFQDADIALAKTLLEEGMQELGITREAFKDIVYYYSTSDTGYKVAQALQDQWMRSLGIQITIQGMAHKLVMDKLIKRNYDFAQSLWVVQYYDQMNILERFKWKANPKNYAGWENPDYIRLLDDSFYANGDKRAEVLEKAEEIFLSEMPICPIYHWNYVYLVQPHLNDVKLTPIGEPVFAKLFLDARDKLR